LRLPTRTALAISRLQRDENAVGIAGTFIGEAQQFENLGLDQSRGWILIHFSLLLLGGNRVRNLLLSAMGCMALTAALFWSASNAAPQEELDPLKVAPDTHKLLFENKFVRVIEAKVPIGSTEPKHKHPRGITVYLADYTVEMKSLPAGKVNRADRKFGTVSWSDAVVHEVKNVGTTPSHAIRMELKY